MSALKEFIKTNRLRQADVCRYLGLSATHLSLVVKGQSQLSAKRLQKLIHNDQGWDPAPLLGAASTVQEDRADYRRCDAPEGCETPRLLPAEIVNAREVDLYEWYQDNSQRAECIDVEELTSGSDFAVRVKGDMMYPRIKPDDIIYVQRLGDHEKILDNTCYFIDTKEGAFVGFLHLEDDKVLCSGINGRNVVTLNENEVFGVYRITNQISSYPVRNDGRAADMNMKSLISRLESSDERTDKLLEELVRAGERVDRALDLVAQMCAKIGNH